MKLVKEEYVHACGMRWTFNIPRDERFEEFREYGMLVVGSPYSGLDDAVTLCVFKGSADYPYGHKAIPGGDTAAALFDRVVKVMPELAKYRALREGQNPSGPWPADEFTSRAAGVDE